MNYDRIYAYEAGELDDEEIIELFQELLDSGDIHHLQGHYQRTAQHLINKGLIVRPGGSVEMNIDWKSAGVIRVERPFRGVTWLTVPFDKEDQVIEYGRAHGITLNRITCSTTYNVTLGYTLKKEAIEPATSIEKFN